MFNDIQISNLSMKEYNYLKPENKKFFQELSAKDKKIPSYKK